MNELNYLTVAANLAASEGNPTADRELITTRHLKAPRELVYKVWTEPQHIAQWWGPTGFTNTVYEMDVRPGGVWRFVMHGPNGVDYPNKIVYTEVVPNQRLVYVHNDDAPEGEDHMDPFHVTVTFEGEGNQTQVTMHMVLVSAAELERLKSVGAVEGCNSTLMCLEEYLATL